MLCIPKIGDYLKILTGNEVKNLLVINFGEYFKSAREKLYFKQNVRKVAELFRIFLIRPDELEKYIEVMQSSSY